MTSLRRGVLRHKPPVDLESKDKFEDLLVFGYACKLFRDDEKALYIDQGKHLIPWMGDENIKIDRYDARGTLFDLKPHEAPQGGYNRFEGLTAEEKHIEELCDEERYFALYKDEDEEAIIKEEEIKRLQQDVTEAVSQEVTYHQVPFSYNNQQEGEGRIMVPEPSAQKSLLGELGDSIYIPPLELDVPPDIVVPPTQKLAKIIEKTANFISSQGAQMEIVLKAKQSNNPMFQFLHFDSALHPFYRHVLTAIRNGTYVVSVEEETADVEKAEEKNGKNSVPQSDGSDSEDEHYLHPSLQSGLNHVPPANDIISESTPFVYPPPTVQPIIDKTASYVARNGRSFENIITSKGDSRFVFLKADHAFHSYYLHKLKTYVEMNGLKSEASIASLPVIETNENHVPERKPEMDFKTVHEDDEEQLRNERRKKAVLFLNKLRQEKPLSNILSLEEKIEESNNPSEVSSNVKAKRKSDSSDDVEIIDAVPKNKTKRSYSRSPSPYRHRRHRKSRSRSRSRRRSRSTERRRRHHKKHRDRSRDRNHRRDRKRKHSHDRSRKKSHRHRSRSRSSFSRSPVKSRSLSPVQSSTPPVNLNVQKVAVTSVSSSETSSPLPPQLQPIQPALAKIAEGIRAKVMAMIDGDRK